MSPDPDNTTDKQKKKASSQQAWREARALIWNHRRQLALGLLLMVVNRVSGLILPWTPRLLIDDVIGKHKTELLVPLALAVAGATVVQGITSFALSQVVGVAGQRAITDMRKRVQARITRLPVRYFDQTQTGVLISRIMSDAEGIRNLVGTGLVQLVGGVVTSSIVLVVLLRLNWKLTLVTLVILGAFAAFMSIAFSRLRPVFRERGKINADVTGRLSQSLQGIRVVKSYVAERREQRVFAHGAHALFRNIKESMTGVSATTALSSVIVGLVGVIMILLGGRSVVMGQMTVGQLVMYLSFTAMMAAPLIEMAAIGTQISEAFAGLDRIREVLAMDTEDQGDVARDGLATIHGDIAFEDVTFEYRPDLPVLKHITLRAPAGSTTALVGSSGSGKSTLISLVMAFNHPKHGRITIDGHDLETLRLGEYRSALGVVLQDNFLFDGTIHENIAFARPDASFEDVRRASRIAHCDEFVEGFEKQYDTIVGERGVRLSGGQRQRVAIARAILADPRILILDEATSSLDSESEALIQDGLNRLRHGRTTFVIAHRLSTIRSADQILVLENGEVVERGTHQELIALNGRYRHLHDRQYAFEQNQFINPGEDFTPEPPKIVPISEGAAVRAPAV
ncbi:MAG TPA: ABC transporter ATP-binding protein [Candidatus Saccharimonadaceae bacterium]|jgi:subfamily B ATP-binding cassette protein MsbA|nr:ABC transporter ATP-binding protein [Candidatus Saccharimonadaceae bacterium]